MMPLNDASREGTPTPLARPESCAVGSRLVKNATPLPPRPSDYQLPATPGNRLLSSRMTNRRNVTLKPIDRPKTPALVPIDDGIRGFKLHTAASHSSPPSTPYVRKDQLPPLDSTPSNIHMGAASTTVSVNERSPPTQLRTSAQKNRVTFNSRIVSAADSSRYSRNTTDQRPSSTTTAFRHGAEGTSRLATRKGSDHLLNYRMKMGGGGAVGVARGKHSGVAPGASGAGAGLQFSELSLRDRATNCIVEDDEAIDDESTSFAVTGTSGFFRKGYNYRNYALQVNCPGERGSGQLEMSLCKLLAFDLHSVKHSRATAYPTGQLTRCKAQYELGKHFCDNYSHIYTRICIILLQSQNQEQYYREELSLEVMLGSPHYYLIFTYV